MKNNIKISVVIPVWNGVKTLEATIKSCLAQTLPPIEILICDDGSTDNSKKIVENINNERVIWIPGNHSGGPALPRNRGLARAQGDWVAFCDSDDQWLPTKLQIQVAKIMETSCSAVCTNAFRKIDNVVTDSKVIKHIGRKISFKNLLKSNDIVCSSSMIHSSLFKQLGGFPEIVLYGSYADYLYWLRITTKTKFLFINEPLVIYNDQPQLSMRRENISDTELKKNAFQNFIEWSKEARNNSTRMLIFRSYIKMYRINTKVTNLIKKYL